MAKCGTKKKPSSPLLELETCSREKGENIFKHGGFLERVCNFSLGFPAFRPSNFFGPRSKVVLRGEGYAWTPVSGSFDKLRKVGVFSYLIYSLFKCFVNAWVDLRP